MDGPDNRNSVSGNEILVEAFQGIIGGTNIPILRNNARCLISVVLDFHHEIEGMRKGEDVRLTVQ